MLTSAEMEKALRAVSLIDQQSLLAVASKLMYDIESGRYGEDFEITANIKVGDLQKRAAWWRDRHIVATIVASIAGQLMRLAISAVGVNPMEGSWKQLLQLGVATSWIEINVVNALAIRGQPA